MSEGGPGAAGDQLPLARPVVDAREQELVLRVLRSGRLSLGPMLERFEEEFAAWLGAEQAVAVSSGTAALHLGVRALGWGRGDAVITSPLSFVASVNCLLYEDVRPVFCDVDPVSFNLDPEAAASAVGPETAGLLPVHIFGYPAATAELGALAERRQLGLLEDACEALGARDAAGGRVGAGAAPATFAFYANKQMTTGEGGMLTTADAGLAARVRSERNQGRGTDMGWLDHERLGFNYRLSELAAAIGVAQVERLGELLAGRDRVAALYGERLGGVGGVTVPISARGEERRSWFVYVVQLDEPAATGLGAAAERAAAGNPAGPAADRAAAERRDRVIADLAARGVPAKAYMPCLHRLAHLERFGFREGQFPVAEAVLARSLALPFFPEMREDQVERVCEALGDAL